MKIGLWARLLLCGAPLLAGCSNFWQAPSTGGGGGGTTLSSGNFYIVNKTATASQVVGYNITSGKLTALSGSPYPVTGQAFAVAVSPSGGFLYVSGTAGIYLYSVDSTSGALTQKSLIDTDPVAAAMAVDPTGAWLIDASAQGYLQAIPITSTGVLDSARKAQQATMASSSVNEIAIAHNNSVVAVALGAAGTQVFPFTATSATPLGTPFSPTIAVKTASGGAATSVAIDPLNRLLFVGETADFPTASNSGGLRVFTLGATTSEVSGSPYASGGTGPNSILVKSTGDFVYVANWAGSSAGNVTAFQITTAGTVFSLKSLASPIATGIQPSGLAEDSKDNFVVAVSGGGSPVLDAYTFDTTTIGKLDAALTGATGTGPIAIVAEP